MGKTERGAVLAVAEHRQGSLTRAGLENAAFARAFSEALSAEARAVLLGRGERNLAEEFSRASGLETFYVEHESASLYNGEVYTHFLSLLAREINPRFLLVPHTATGWDFAARLAVVFRGGLASGVNGFEVREGRVLFLRPGGRGRMIEEVESIREERAEGPAVVTVLPGSAKLEQEGSGKKVRVKELSLAGPDILRSRTLGYKAAERGEADLAKAEVIVAAGRGVGGPEHLNLAQELAACFPRSALAASRPVVDAGWLPVERQVGQTGWQVAPRLYIALGISGALQHVAGMKDSELIVAVNKDPKAPIFNVAHLGVVADLHRFVPLFINALKNAQGTSE